MTEISIYSNVIDTLDIVARIEKLESKCDGGAATANLEELAALESLIVALRGKGNQEWRGNWYPSMIVRDDHFEAFAADWIKDVDGIPCELHACVVIDWAATAHNIQQNYSSVEFGGVTFWYRSPR